MLHLKSGVANCTFNNATNVKEIFDLDPKSFFDTHLEF
jgi:hypothetical protein